MNGPKSRALVIGDQERAPYHPLGAVRGAIADILAPSFLPEFSTDYESVKDLGRDELLVSYTDCWKFPPSDTQVAAVVDHVAGGGGLLVLHCGISLQSRPEFAQLIGARFTGHPPMQELRFVSATDADQLFVRRPDENHPEYPRPGNPIATPAFDLLEEPYRFEFDPLAGITVVWVYEMEGTRYPAAWIRRFGMGRVVYTMPGHWLASFQGQDYRTYLCDIACWAAKKC